ncbi:MAG: SusC/RagA family TonB-linked outer membrane protein [Sphingobacteriales bacterium 50-39]|nr:SusC/RagA family TonB-linked outer membrane protein [Sphingobacteriales bacterium]OJW57192.1 MAG: SusC/RagA family TonB-linked outer membrane protein [Sphingobacteriales bacterium 50-39]
MTRMLTWVFLLIACSWQVTAQSVTNTATGIVKNDKGAGMEGVTVRLENASNGFKNITSTNSRGVFSFSNVPVGSDYRFIISSVGYDSDTLTGYEMKENGRISLAVVLQPKNSSLESLVVIGYGAMRKKDLSAAVSTVPDMAQIKERPVLDALTMIQGKVPGVTIVSNGGHPDQGPTLYIRGTGSRNGDAPLFVVDGVPGAPYNPADVESVTILKDAASAAIYGAFSGSAGVVIITTRQAGKGNPSVEYSGFVGAKNAWKLPQSLKAADEAKVSNLAYTNAGMPPLDGWDATKNPYDQVTRTDWVRSIFRTGLIHRHNLTLNAGTEKFSTLFQGRYEENEGTLLNTYAKNMSLRFNATYTFDSHVKFRQELFLNNNDKRGTSTESGYTGTILSAIYMPRAATVYYDDGTFGGVGPRNSQYLGIHGDVVNPVATLLRNQPYDKSLDVQSVSELKVTNVIPGITYISRFSYRQGQSLYKNFIPKRTEPGKPNDQNELDYSTNKPYSWIWENTINYAHNFGQHSIGAMVSTTAQEAGGKGFSASAKTFDNEATWSQFFINAQNFTDIKPTDWDWKDRNLSYVGRVTYSWADRYFLTGSYRWDIADRLPLGHRVIGVPGVTAAWKLSSEPFFHLAGVNLLKIRGSWGRVGNLSTVPTYYGYPLLNNDYSYQVGNGAPQSTALYVGNFTNTNLTWETAEQKDLGLDVSLLKDRLSFTLDYFDKLTYNLITGQTLNWPNTYGIGAPLINQGKIQNTGFEFAATWRDKAGDLGYELSANFATLKNRVKYIDQDPNSSWPDGSTWRGTLSPYRSIVGQPYLSYWLVKTAGIFQTDAEAANYMDKNGNQIQPNAHAGDLKFLKQHNGVGQINDSDRVYMGSALPKFTYGFTANLSWKRFDLSMFWQGVAGVKLFHAFKESTLNGAEQGYNRWDKILDAWSPTNTKSNIPMIRANDPNNNFQTASDWYLESGNYLRLKSVVIGYNFPRFYRNTTLRVYVSGDNLITITKYSGMDPEVGGIGFDGGQFPLARVYAAGVKLTF